MYSQNMSSPQDKEEKKKENENGQFLTMLPPDSYISNHSLQLQDTVLILKKFKSKMKLNENLRVIDIGCGPGDISHDHLLPLIRSDGQVVGIDKSCSMIDRAKNRSADPRLSFQVFDITETEIVDKFESYFDSAFSFYCLNWIQDFRTAIKNIYSILKPGGEALLTWPVDGLLFSLFETLATSPKWSPYMPDYIEAISIHRNIPDPVSEVTNLMQHVGFQVDECSVYMHYYTFSSKEKFYEWINAVNPFLKNIPAHLLKEFHQDSLKIIWDKTLFWRLALNELTNEVTYRLLLISVLARK